MKGFLARDLSGGISAWLVDEWGYEYLLLGTKADRDGTPGYEIEVKLKKIPGTLAVPGDEEHFEITPVTNV